MIKKISKDQPESFQFNEKSKRVAEKIINNYPEGKQQSAVMALLYIAQRQNNNWIPLAAMKYIAKFLDMPYIKVYEVATFYTMYNLSPVGKYFVQVCTTSPCLLRGAGQIVKSCQNKISKNQNEISKNGNCSWTEVECLGACVNAPMIQVNKDYYEDLDIKSADKILDSFLDDKPIKPGSFRNRNNTAPVKNKNNGIRNA